MDKTTAVIAWTYALFWKGLDIFSAGTSDLSVEVEEKMPGFKWKLNGINNTQQDFNSIKALIQAMNASKPRGFGNLKSLSSWTFVSA